MKSILVISLLCLFLIAEAQENSPKYICPPCSEDCHNQSWSEPGECPVCGMELLNADNINEGLKYQHIFPVDLCEIVSNNPDVVFLDVRTEAEYNQESSQLGIMKNAINIPIQELADRLKELEEYQDREMVVYCSISMRSPRASKLLADNGFEDIKNLLGGMSTWNTASEEEVSCKNELLVR